MSAVDRFEELVTQRDSLGDAMRNARQEVGLTGEQLALCLGLRDHGTAGTSGTSQVYAWESGRVPRSDMLKRIVEVLRHLEGFDGDLEAEIPRLSKESRWKLDKVMHARAAARRKQQKKQP